MYAVCKTIHPSTQVEHSICCHFYNYSEKNLITAGLNQLKVYRLINVQIVSKNVNDPITRNIHHSEDIDDLSDNIKLECLQTFTLNANIESLNSVSFLAANRDCLLLAFNDAKLSVVEYDPNTHDLKTISMHYFEDDDMRSGYTTHVRPPLVRVDPENRCAAMLVYNKNILIIPFRKDVVVEDNQDSLFLSSLNSQNTPSMNQKKLPVLPSYKLILNPEQYGVNITNVLDIQFLHNYYEPTLMILYEPVQTWPGRIAVRQDTVSMITLSLDVHQRVHPHIWSMNNLPFNTFAALPIPKPIGGVLISATNALIHLNQGLPPYGISLNGFNDSNTSFPLKTQDDVIISLDCCQATFISNNKILLSLKNGELYVLKLYNDMTRSVRTFNFIHIASSVIATSIVKCDEGFYFIGSRLSHSLLIQYDEKTDMNNTEISSSTRFTYQNGNGNGNLMIIPEYNENIQSEDEYLYGDDWCNNQQSKRSNLDDRSVEEFLDSNEKHEGNVNEEQSMNSDKEEIENINDENPTQSLLRIHHKSIEQHNLSCSLKLCDIIYNIGPCGNVCIGEPNMALENMASQQDIHVEIVTTSGYFQTGGVSVLQRSIKPQIETSFKLPGCYDCWTAYSSNLYYSDNDAMVHKYLIITQEDSTLVFQIGQEINELDQSGFITQSPTIFAGNIGDNKYILQVCARSVRLLDGTRELQHFPIDIGSPLVHVSTADPYAVIISEKGLIIMLRLKIDLVKSTARLVVLKPDLSTAKSRIVSHCIYKDVSGLFTTQTKITESINSKKSTIVKQKNSAPPLTSTISTLSSATTIDEEDELLYGNSMASFLNNNNDCQNQNDQHMMNDDNEEKYDDDDAKITIITKTEPTYWLFIVRENGVLEIYNLPEFKLVYLIKNFPLGLRVLVDSIQTTDHSYQNQTDMLTMPITKEILVCGMGLQNSHPYLFARFDEDFFIYEIFSYYESQVENHLKIRFKKIGSHLQFVKLPKFYENNNVNQNYLYENRSWLRSFTNIGGFSGVFLCGPYPCWFFMTYRGELRTHSMEIDGAISSFAMFNNVNCPNGYLYFNDNEELRFSTLANRYELDSYWPCKHIPINRTVHYVNYHPESKTYAIVTSRLIDITKIVRIGGEEKDYDFIETDSRYIHCKTEQFELQLLSPVNWTIIPGTLVQFDEWEHITSLKTVMLASEGTSSGLKGYIAVSTNYSYGEDVTNRGRIWIFDIIEVVPEPGKPLTKNKIKIVYCKEQKGPVTVICQVCGYLLSAIGQKIYIWQLKESQLIGIAFIDTQIYVHAAISLKNLILVSDVYKSISLLRYQEETRTLSLVSRDHRSLQVYACEYLIDNSQMCFVVSDVNKNIILYAYQPDQLESIGGTRLIRRGDFHLGSFINSFFRIRCRIQSKNIDNRLKQTYLRRHITTFATLDGSIGYLLPVPEKTYRRLLMLQNLLTTNIQHIAGLNPKAFRMIKMRKMDLMNPSKNILDGDLLYKYVHLSLNEKFEIAKKIGTSAKQIIDDLQEIHSITAHF
ncbi:cleavage and polyadenylation specificity factor subunit 1 [Dermatophagoides pteronyssinus]|uniref:cleavage and polyadenylation specificity factor subunit 1 n=1 Tax=Dermatophagoides pteronyssinus TaxID=6956 RepID=UPI003F676DC0